MSELRDQRLFTSDDWKRISEAQDENTDSREFPQLWRLFESLAYIEDGFDITQQDHTLMMAHMAVEDEAPEEIVLVALLHDIAKPLSLVNHPAVAAEIVKHRVSSTAYLLIKYHALFLHDKIYGGGVQFDWPQQYGKRNFLRLGTKFADWDSRAVDPALPRMRINEAQARLLLLFPNCREDPWMEL